MKINSEAIYETRAIEPYKEGKVCFTQKKDGTIYAIYLADEGETELPASITLNGITMDNGHEISLLGSDIPVIWKKTGSRSMIVLPHDSRSQTPCKYAWVFKIQKVE
jgi:alpha-L-fucosidase